ncbi:MAG: methylenetetrahydrofolate reductase [NAD(P)H] [Phycisphaerae bacterium]|nr:methylenetetrahydrofolate reductase [NAD(P)H] [Phycisphaerae bacterium]
MSLLECFARRRPTFSFEFFPPASPEAASRLFATIAELERLRPTFVSITYGAGGSTRDLTHGLVERLCGETRLTAVPHVTCVGHTIAELEEVVGRYRRCPIGAIMALRGDRRADGSEGELRFAADLVRLIRRAEPARSTRLAIGVAGYPEGHPDTPNRLVEIEHLKAKVDAGADFIVTQLFFDNRDFLDFRDRCALAGIRAPIVAGLMPITSLGGMRRMADLALGMRYPAALLRAIARAGDQEEAVARVGVHWATEQARDLLDHGVAGIHFYTLNRSAATREVYANLGVADSEGLAAGAPTP